jgi:hypothetical protein
LTQSGVGDGKEGKAAGRGLFIILSIESGRCGSDVVDVEVVVGVGSFFGRLLVNDFGQDD